jgi:hypothetical protein
LAVIVALIDIKNPLNQGFELVITLVSTATALKRGCPTTKAHFSWFFTLLFIQGLFAR